MSSEIGVLLAAPFLLLAGVGKCLVEVGKATASATAATAVGSARLIQQGASWIRANGLAADQLAAVTMAPTNLSRAEFHTLAQACGLKTAKTVRNTSLGLAMTPITVAASGQQLGLVQTGNNFHLVGAADLIQAGPKMMPDFANFHQLTNAVAATKAVAGLGANLGTIQRDQARMLYIDINILNPVASLRPVGMTTPTPKTLDVGALACRIAATKAHPASPGLQPYQGPPEGYLRVAMEVLPGGRFNISVLGDHGYEAECKPVADALTEAFGNARIFCNLRGIGQAPPPGAGLIPIPESEAAPAINTRPVSKTHVRR